MGDQSEHAKKRSNVQRDDEKKKKKKNGQKNVETKANKKRKRKEIETKLSANHKQLSGNKVCDEATESVMKKMKTSHAFQSIFKRKQREFNFAGGGKGF